MSSITTQQTKLDLELVPKEERLEIGKCNGRLNPGKKQREPTFQVVLDALSLTPCYSAFITTADVPKVDMHQFWDSIHKYDNSYKFRMDKKKKFDLNLEIFRDIFQIYPRVHGQNFDEHPTDEDIVSFFKELGHTREIKSLSGKTTGLDKLRLSKAHILWGFTIRRMWTMLNYFGKISLTRLTTEVTKSKTRCTTLDSPKLSFITSSPKTTQSPRETRLKTKANKTYLGYATRATPPKKARKFKKPASSKLNIVLVSLEEPTTKSKRFKRPAKKSTNAPTTCVVIRDTPVMSLFKKKENVTVDKCKVIDLLSKVALNEEAQYEEVYKKSLRDFHKTHPSGSGTVTKIALSAGKIKPSVTNEGTGAKPGVPDVTKEESTESEAESWGRDEDDSNNDRDSRSEGSDQESDNGSESDQEENEEEVEDDEEEEEEEFVKTPYNYSDDEDEANEESKVEDNVESDENQGIDDTINQFDDDVDVRLNEQVNTDEGFIQKEGTDDEMINFQQGNENPMITHNQVIKDAHLTLFTVTKKTKVPVTSSSHTHTHT
ncbi:hypothetical protein Tco_0880854, partial [Tanacetum coccineum]